jgi:hypothetical protein
MTRISGPAGSKLSGIAIRHRTNYFPRNLVNFTGSVNVKVSASAITISSLSFPSQSPFQDGNSSVVLLPLMKIIKIKS